MEYLFRILFGKGAATSIAALLLFTTPEVALDEFAVVITGTLDGIFTQRVERIIHTGTEVSVTYDISLTIKDTSGRALENRKLQHRIRYDDLEKMYHLAIDGRDTLVKEKQAAYKLIEKYHIRIPHSNAYSGAGADLYIEAAIHYSSSLQVDMPDNVLWEYFIPNKKLRNITLGK